MYVAEAEQISQVSMYVAEAEQISMGIVKSTEQISVGVLPGQHVHSQS